MSEPRIVLHQFQRSHFNEKARWALDWKGLPHVRETYLPGPHVPQMKRLSGQTATPVLVIDGEVIAGSARILAELDRRFPERPLHPADPELRRRALALQQRFDDEVGPAIRTLLFSVLIPEPDYLCEIFASSKPAPVRWLYRRSLPLVKAMIARANAAHDPRDVERARVRTEQALDEVAKTIGPSGQLAGDAFCVADLTAAALLSLLAEPKHPDMARPQPVPARVAELVARYASHPAIAWVNEQYERHRPPSCARPAGAPAPRAAHARGGLGGLRRPAPPGDGILETRFIFA